jgi:hypothetical protein
MTATITPTDATAPAATAANDIVDRTADALRRRGFEVRVATDRAEARDLVLAAIPEGASVHQGASATLDELGVTEIIEGSGRYDAVRPRLRAMDRKTQGREIRHLGATPDVILGSAQAVTEDGQLVFASATGSQLGGYASGAGKVVWVVGAQKIVPDLASALDRVEHVVTPLEDERLRAAYGMGTRLNKLLIVRGDLPGRVTIVLVREALGY